MENDPRPLGPILDRRALLRAGGALAVGAGAVGGAATLGNLVTTATAQRGIATDELRIGYLPITDAAPLLVAHGDGYFEQQKIIVGRPVLFRSWSSLMEAFLTRQVDLIHLLMPSAVQLRYVVGADAKVVSWNHTGGGAITVAPHVRDVAQLAGTQVAIPGWWSIHNILLQRVLRAHGLTPVARRAASRSDRTVELVVMGPSDMIPALATGSISAFTVADPFNAGAVARGVGSLHMMLDQVWRDHACCVTVVHEDLIDRRPDTVQALVDATVAAQLGIRADRTSAAALLSGKGYLPQPPKAVEVAMTGTVSDPSGGRARPRIDFHPYPFPSFTSELVRQMRTTVVDGDARFLDGLDPSTVHGELVDNRFVRASIARHGGPTVLGLPASLTRHERLI
ncbi:ABC transporter substrate-binding protein [Dietzia sp. ANT_WB102]|uniref:ABC transporter substrate-binding protein n=1 Tax=Dietzia sp. ANT_WB102 TaxID=2597345 RepID=UPI0011EF5766|nr:ABC transporter substrate-binding protein [Dietzia sp. ANT_WB102]KAA0919378.1 ABC transporter substrate-binding protein [Dietzia sp. ANT_WB102]